MWTHEFWNVSAYMYTCIYIEYTTTKKMRSSFKGWVMICILWMMSMALRRSGVDWIKFPGSCLVTFTVSDSKCFDHWKQLHSLWIAVSLILHWVWEMGATPTLWVSKDLCMRFSRDRAYHRHFYFESSENSRVWPEALVLGIMPLRWLPLVVATYSTRDRFCQCASKSGNYMRLIPQPFIWVDQRGKESIRPNSHEMLSFLICS